MSGKLEGKIALVTGGTGGIGLATAQRFVKEGAYVFVTGRRQAELDAAAKLMSGHVTADSSNLEDLDNLFAQIKREKGRLDIVYANAGGGSFAPIGGIYEQHFDHTFDTNVKGTLFTVQKALPLVPDGGSIIMTGSTAGSTAMPAFSVYSASKAAIRSFARCWTLGLKDRKIRVNVVSPGPIETPGIAGLAPNEEQRRGFYSTLASQVPLGRMGQPDEIAKVAVFL
ncbi:MAG TPA: SDR family oxidoreductase, partial [Candidatus Sulfotelmatobacter sp.]|nr:SDR family oxidoreductase [Candidatus Sulfotelmatobacter sp.]